VGTQATRPDGVAQLALQLNMQRHVDRAVDRNENLGVKSGLQENIQNGPCRRTTLATILNLGSGSRRIGSSAV
jgi:hypothetical protein